MTDQQHAESAAPRTNHRDIKIKVVISLVCSAAALVHALFPWMKVDLVTVILIAVGVLPWLAPIVKSVELPGGFKIELQDVKAATDKVTATPLPPSYFPISTAARQQDPSTIETLQNLAKRDPNLALVGVRIEIEKRLSELSRRRGIDPSRKSVGVLLRELQRQQALSPEMAAGLNDLIALGNRAAHGAEVSADAAGWVLDSAPLILGRLDDWLSSSKIQLPEL